jgi:hypothetical protein
MVPERDAADWPKQIADQVEHYVRLIRDNVTVKVVKAIRSVVFGLIAVIVGVSALVLLVITFERIVRIPFFGRIWLAHLATGVIFIAVGSLCMRKRHAPRTES